MYIYYMKQRKHYRFSEDTVKKLEKLLKLQKVPTTETYLVELSIAEKYERETKKKKK